MSLQDNWYFFFLSKETRKGAQFTTKEEDKEAELVAAR
jgi:hypothetical protein